MAEGESRSADVVKLKMLGVATGGEQLALFFCPGCSEVHPYRIGRAATEPERPVWTFNGDLEKPTFTPSLLCNKDDPKSRCHLYLTDGQIVYLGDCHHALAGQTVPCPNWDDEKW